MYEKMGDIKSLLAMHVKFENWDDAFALMKQYPEYKADIYLPYANFLALHDRFDEAREAFKDAGQPLEALRMLQTLTHNAVVEKRYGDAGYYYWLMALDELRSSQSAGRGAKSDEHFLRFLQLHHKAQLYYAYDNIHKYTEEPFTALSPDNLFQIAQFVLNEIGDDEEDVPFGISQVNTVFTMAKHGQSLGLNKFARAAYQRLVKLKLPVAWRDQIENSCLKVRTTPYLDKEDMLPICHRCSQSGPALNPEGDCCPSCAHQTIRSFCFFESLPLVEFFLEDGITHEQAVKLIEAAPELKQQAPTNDGKSQSLLINDDDDEEGDDEFHRQLNYSATLSDGSLAPIKLGARALRAMPKEEVFIVQWPTQAAPTKYYRVSVPDVPIAHCKKCNHFFHEEDYEFHVLQHGSCPFCRTPVQSAEESDDSA